MAQAVPAAAPGVRAPPVRADRAAGVPAAVAAHRAVQAAPAGVVHPVVGRLRVAVLPVAALGVLLGVLLAVVAPRAVCRPRRWPR